MHSGAAGYVCKQEDLGELLSAIKAVLSGYNYFPSQALNAAQKLQQGTGVVPPGQ
jgi:two-component system response regulator EvgA